MTPDLAGLLARHRPRLVAYFERKAGALRRHESPEDLAQGVHVHALEHAAAFTFRGERAFVGWMLRLARQHLARRVRHWTALRRDAGPLLRITFGGSTARSPRDGVHPADAGPGPSTRASTNEQIEIAARALDGLPPRDRELVRLVCGDVAVRDVAERLGLTEAAAQRARLRALERFRKIYRILERQRHAP